MHGHFSFKWNAVLYEVYFLDLIWGKDIRSVSLSSSINSMSSEFTEVLYLCFISISSKPSLFGLSVLELWKLHYSFSWTWICSYMCRVTQPVRKIRNFAPLLQSAVYCWLQWRQSTHMKKTTFLHSHWSKICVWRSNPKLYIASASDLA